ncbi:unnamed protein product [Sphagnum troendelagicum]|uniref:BED-type domain-containing protein n=1 Tax=Sphagnum troendelagicum TaxID=128251 RepID=A0ABP0T9G0_9BRYO
MEDIEVVVVDDDIAMEVRAPERKRGRSASAVWNWFTDDASPQNAKSAKCMHCKTLINHHKKSESAKVHLNSCAKFRTLMNGLNDDERPNWYRLIGTDETKKVEPPTRRPLTLSVARAKRAAASRAPSSPSRSRS